MQPSRVIAVFTVASLLVVAGGCEKSKSEPVPPPAPRPLEAATSAGTNAAAAAQAAAEATAKAQAILDNARKLVVESKWREALQTLRQIESLKLAPEQQQAMLSLKQQLEKMIQDAMAKQAATNAPKN
jgi:hypothetical protein